MRRVRRQDFTMHTHLILCPHNQAKSWVCFVKDNWAYNYANSSQAEMCPDHLPWTPFFNEGYVATSCSSMVDVKLSSVLPD